MTYLERLAVDPDLRAFVDAEVQRACVELAALRAEHTRLTAIVAAQAQRIADYEAAAKKRQREQR